VGGIAGQDAADQGGEGMSWQAYEAAMKALAKQFKV
jgi:hypothetical protein